MRGCKTCKGLNYGGQGHIIGACGEWSESSTELNTYMHRVKHLVCAVVVMVHDHFPWLISLGRCSTVKEDTLVLNARVENM